MELFNAARSSASYRVRIALAIKGLPFDYKPIGLAKSEQLGADYAAKSASRLVPLMLAGDVSLSQSMAIIEYLDETHPQPPLMPFDALGRARVRALAQDVACEIHPLNNLRVLRYLVHTLKVSEDDKNAWYRHWVESGLEVLERQLTAAPARFCHGDTPTLADCCLVPQIFNAHRFKCSTAHVPQVMRVFDECMTLDAFELTRPERCADFA